MALNPFALVFRKAYNHRHQSLPCLLRGALPVLPEGSVTHWLELLKTGDVAAAQRIWERYFPALVRLARQRLWGAPRAAADEEDVALSAFAGFCRNAEKGRFPKLNDREDLWRLLAVSTTRKVIDKLRQENLRPTVPAELDLFLSREPDPALAAELTDECRRLLGLLGEDELRKVALWKMEGYTTEEIAAKLGCVTRTVERKVSMIRRKWEKELPS
jgi:RNA polymerase sigma factor (sigma-70 family)